MEALKIKKCIQEIVELLALKDYEAIAERDFMKQLNANDLKRSILDYGGTVTSSLNSDFDDYDFYFLSGENNIISIEYDLYIDGIKSDLTMVFYFKDGDGQSYDFSIYGIYVQ